jgi:hypothetical protein
MTLFEVLEYGPIMASDPETGCLVTANGSYLNFWAPRKDYEWENTDCRASGICGGWLELGSRELVERAEAYLREVLCDASGGDA